MRVVTFITVLCITTLICSPLAIPIARVMGCGKEDPELEPEKKYCCDHFGKDCEQDNSEPKPVSIRSEEKDTPSLDLTVKRPRM